MASGGQPICAQCKKPITGTVTTAMGKTWHKEHFVCTHCKKPFNGAAYYEHDDKPYCEADNKKLFQASGDQYICAKCNKPITGTVTTAMGKTWHNEHFVCTHCKKPFNGAAYYVHDDKPYCEADNKKLFQASGDQYICAQCNKPITGTVTTAMGKTWHNEHFVCTHCKKPFNGAAYYVHDDKPYCEADNKKLFQASGDQYICAQCNKPITGTVTTAMGKTWHSEHFVCAQCKKPFNGAAFYVHDDKPYCEADNKKLFQGQGNQASGGNPICAQCNKPITGTVTTAMGKSWHKEHFVCAHCKKPFNGAAFYVHDDKPYCEADNKKLFQGQGNQASGDQFICAQCHKSITGTVTTAMGKTWHSEHFFCAQCKKPFNGAAYFVKDDKPYCVADYMKLFHNQGNLTSGGFLICEQCNKPITGTVTTAMGKYWHKEDFVCVHCKKPFNGAAFYVHDNKPYCEADNKKLFQGQGNQATAGYPTCAKCNKPITDNVTVSMGKTWHIEHFVCTHCKKPFKGAAFFVQDGNPYCVADYTKLFQNQGNQASGGNPICAQCNKPITGTVTTAMGKTWHNEHFVCAHCKKTFNGAAFYVHDDKPYCEADNKKLFQGQGNQDKGGYPICAQCNKPITDCVTTAMDKTWHKEHFVCAHCKKPFYTSAYYVQDGKPYCEADQKKLFPTCLATKPICAYCNKPISDVALKALGKSYHRGHLLCAHCKKPIHETSFKEHDGKPYCDKDYDALYRKRCSGCGQLIEGIVLTALHKDWHKKCFVCSKCHKPISAQQGFTEKEGKPFCLACAI